MRILDFLKNKIDLIAQIICVASCGLWMMVLTHRYYFLNSGGWDTAFHAHTLWNLSHGSFFNSLLNANFLVEHCSFLNFLVVPFYWLWPHPLLLQYLKIAAFMGGAYILFKILIKTKMPFIALLGMMAFILAPANVAMLLFGFNYEPLSIPLVFLIFKSFEEKKYTRYLIGLVLLMLIKEQMPLVVLMFGVMAFLVRKEHRFKWALVPLLVGACVFIFEVFVLTPYMRQGLPIEDGYYWRRYEQFGQTPGHILFSLVSNPHQVIQYLAMPLNQQWYQELFDYWGWLSLLSPHILLPALPLFIKNLLSSNGIEHQLTKSYYAATFTPFVFLAVFKTLDYVKGRRKNLIQGLVVMLMFMHALSYFPIWLQSIFVGSNLKASNQLMKAIPSDASVMTGDSTLTPLVNRPHVYQFDSYLWGYYQISGKPFVLPEDAQYILLNMYDYFQLLGVQHKERFISKISDLNFSPTWTLKETIEDMVLWERQGAGQNSQRLIEISDQSFLKEKGHALITGDSIALENMDYPHTFSGKDKLFPIVFYWQSLIEKNGLYRMKLTISDQQKVVYEKLRIMGSVIYPSYLWHKGEFIKERYNCLLPDLKPGQYSLEIQIFDSSVCTLKTNFLVN